MTAVDVERVKGCVEGLRELVRWYHPMGAEAAATIDGAADLLEALLAERDRLAARVVKNLEPFTPGTYACCVHCVDDVPHIAKDTHDCPCNAANPCPQEPLS